MKQYLNYSDIIEIVTALKNYRDRNLQVAGILTNEESRGYVLGIAEQAQGLAEFFESVAGRVLNDDAASASIPCRGL